MKPHVDISEFGRLPDGSAASLYRFSVRDSVAVSLTNYGGIVTSITAPDRNGKVDEITLSHSTLADFLQGHPYYGATVGRYANRVSGGGFFLDGQRVEISRNKGELQLHGGYVGFDKKLFSAEPVTSDTSAGVQLSLTSPDGEEGYPGTLAVTLSVVLHEPGTLTFTYHAETDAPTVVNLTNHTYWNLAGTGTILDHMASIRADKYVETDDKSIPTGRLVDVGNTAFDFRTPKTIRRDFDQVASLATGGYDHCYAVSGWNESKPGSLLPVAEVSSPESGRRLTVRTTCPGIQFYSGNHLPGCRDRSGSILQGQEAFCLETQYFPDSVNQPAFPSTVLRPGEAWDETTEYTIGLAE